MGLTDDIGPIYRIVKERGIEKITLIARAEDPPHDVIGAVEFASLADMDEVARAILDHTEDPPPFPGYDVSLHDCLNL